MLVESEINGQKVELDIFHTAYQSALNPQA